MSIEHKQTTAAAPLSDDERNPIWAAVQEVGAAVNHAIACGAVPDWVLSLSNAISVAQEAMDREFNEEDAP